MDIVVNGTRLHYIDVGTKQPLVLLHGLGLNVDSFRNQIPSLAKQYRVIGYDLRGMGKSEAPGYRGAKYTFELHANDFEDLLGALNIDRVAIVAHAYGGMVAMQWAMKSWQRISAMILVNTTAKLGEPGISQALYRAMRAECDGMQPLLDTAMTRWFRPEVHSERPEIIQFYRELLGSTPPMGYAASARSLWDLDLLEGLAQIHCPTLVIAGEKDWATPPAHHEQIAKRIPGARLVIVKNASHTVPEEQPEEFTRLTLDFLSKAYSDGR
jgi:3-oxoadipate enol-lactonase